MDELEKTAQETAAEEQTGDTTAPRRRGGF